MTPPRRDPYLWIHLAGLATLPLWLDICLAGLAVGDPVVSPGLELITLGLVGTLPILWMQLQRPFYIFSVPGLALRPDQLSVERRRLLSLQRTLVSRLLVIFSAIALLFGLYWLYQLAPIAADMTPFAAKSRATGWAITAISFLCANLFVQVPATVLPLLLASPPTLQKTEPFESTLILKQFTVVGLRIESVLPDLLPAVVSPVPETSPSTMPDPGAPAMPTSEAAATTAAPPSSSNPESLDETTTPIPSPCDPSATSDEPSTTVFETADSLDDENETDTVSVPSYLPSLTDAEDGSQSDVAETVADESASALISDALPSSPGSPLADEPEAAPASSESELLAQDIPVDLPVESDEGHDAATSEDHASDSAGILEISDLSIVLDPSEQSTVENDDAVMSTDMTVSDEIALHVSIDFSKDDSEASVFSQES